MTPLPQERLSDPQADLRRQFVQTLKAHKRACETADSKGLHLWEAGYPRADWSCFAGLVCGARTRAGGWCQVRAIHASGRCKFHGGLSTGPTTAAGKRRAAANGLTPKQTPWSA